MINIIVAYDENYAIGRNNELLWLNGMRSDLQHFRSLTIGNTVIMGRKTYDSIGKPLPGRQNIILTSQNIDVSECEVAHTMQEALNVAVSKEVFIIGGQKTFEEALPFVKRIYATIVHHSFDDADTFFIFDNNDWKEVSRVKHTADEKNLYDYSFVTYQRV